MALTHMSFPLSDINELFLKKAKGAGSPSNTPPRGGPRPTSSPSS
jgi:hypothetical protein